MDGILNYKIKDLGDGKCVIHAHYRVGRKLEVRMSTGKKIVSTKSWDENKQRVKNLAIEKNATNINRWLTQKHLDIESDISELEVQNPSYNRNHIKLILKIAFEKASKVEKSLSLKKSNPNPILTDFYKWYADYFAVNPTPTTQKPLAPSTVKSFKSTYKKFQDFNAETQEHDYNDITMEFYEKFTNWLRAQGYSTNYIGNNIKNLKTVMNYALSREYHKNLEFKKREFAKPKEEVDTIYLDEKELTAIYNLELTGSLNHSRNLFLIASYTGLRVSDFNRLKPSNIITIKGAKYIKIKSQKTSQWITIPCNSRVLSILDKYDGNPIPKKSEQKLNKDLKKIGAAAEINTLIPITKIINGISKTKDEHKYNLITSHCARRSFCTNAYKAGLPTFDIMAISGHKTERVFYSYIRVTNEDKAQKIAQHPFFK